LDMFVVVWGHQGHQGWVFGSCLHLRLGDHRVSTADTAGTTGTARHEIGSSTTPIRPHAGDGPCSSRGGFWLHTISIRLMLHAKKYVLCNPYTSFHKADRPAAGIDCAENPIGPGSSWSWPGDRGRREAHKCCLHAHREQRLVIIYYSVRLGTSPRSTVCGATRSRRALRSTAAAGKSLIPHPLSLASSLHQHRPQALRQANLD
jgi:hypothetical protein